MHGLSSSNLILYHCDLNGHDFDYFQVIPNLFAELTQTTSSLSGKNLLSYSSSTKLFENLDFLLNLVSLDPQQEIATFRTLHIFAQVSLINLFKGVLIR